MFVSSLNQKESPVTDSWKQKIIDADCFDPEMIKEILHFESEMMKGTSFSLAAGTINKIITVKDLIRNIIEEAESILKSLGFQGDIINFN
jgi:hypothetical protein